MGSQLCNSRGWFNRWGILQILVLAFAFTGCKDGGQTPQGIPTFRNSGAYVLCEGNFQRTPGTVYYLDTAGDFSAIGDVYKQANGTAVGNVLESATLRGNDLYLVVNNSNKIERLEVTTLKRQAAVTDLVSPRYMLPLPGDTVAAVTDLYANKLSLLSLPGLAHRRTISTNGWTEAIERVDTTIYVAQSALTATLDDTKEQLLVISTKSFAKQDSFSLGRGLRELAVLPNNMLALGFEGVMSSSDLLPSLVIWSMVDRQIKYNFALQPGHPCPSRFTISPDGRYLAFLSGSIYILDLQTFIEPTTLAFKSNANFSALTWLPKQSITRELWVGDAKDYDSPGKLYRLRLPSDISNFSVVDSTNVGVTPGQILFF